MAITVESSADLVKSLESGETIIPEDVKADNEAKVPRETKPEVKEPEKAEKVEKEPDDEDENGLTAEQRKDLTEKMQKAIGKKHRALREAEEFAAAQYNEKRMAQQQAEQYQREINRLKAQLNGNDEVKAADDGKPKREAYETDEAYQDAVLDWKVEQRLKERDAQSHKQAQEERQREIVATAQQRIAKAQDLVPDYAEVVGEAEQEVPSHIAVYMGESEMIAELGYYFAKHPEELERLSKLSPAKALVDVGKIESKLKPFSEATAAAGKVEEEQSPKTVTPSKPRPAAPITPLGSESALQVEKEVSAMNIRETIDDWSKRNNPGLTRRARH